MKTYPFAFALLALMAVGCKDDAATDDSTDDSSVTGDDSTADDSTADDSGTDAFVFATDPPSAYVRVDRMGMPAIATAVISSKDAYNAADPADDANGDFVGEIVASLNVLHDALDDDLVGLGITPCTVDNGNGSCVTQAAPLVIPDTLKIDLLAVSGTPGFPNGRRLEDPVIDVTLAVVLLDLSVHGAGTLVGVLNPAANDVPFTAEFPYLAAPH